MAVEKDQTAIQLLKILYKQNKTKKRKLTKTHYRKSYPRAIEAKYKTKLTSYFRPLIDFITEFLEKNQVAMLKGDSVEFKCDAMPGGTFRRMVQSLEGWVSVYMPTVAEMKDGQNNVILMGLGQTAEQLKAHEDAQFQKQLQNGIGVSFQTNASWWPNTKATWVGNNYNLIVSNARNYVNQINNLAEQGVVNGWSVKQLQEQIKKASNGLSDKKCRLLARDQIGKLQGQVSEAQMEEVGLEMYVWDTSGDERVRPSHKPMDGLLCRWDNANVCSYDNSKTWVERPATAVRTHPGQDIQCRCVALAYIPELLFEMEGTSLSERALILQSVQNLPQSKGNFEDIEYTQNEIDAVNYWIEGNDGWAYQDIRAIANGSPIEETSLVSKQIKNNNMSRAEELKDYLQKIYDDFDKAVKKSLPPEEEFLYRISPSLNVPEVGESLDLEKFSSFTFKPTESFYNNFNKGDGTVMFILKSDKNFADISKIGTSFTQEYEAISKEAMSYKATAVIDKKIQGKTYHLVSLEYEKTNEIIPRKYIPPKKQELSQSEKDFNSQLDFQMKVVTEAMMRGIDLSDKEAIKKLTEELKNKIK